MKLIGINGHKGSGKGEVGRILAREFEAHTVGFSDKLKILAARALGVQGTDKQLVDYMDEFKNYGDVEVVENGIFAHRTTGRRYLQYFGDNTRQMLGDNVWLDAVLPSPYGPYTHQSALWLRFQPATVVAITDLRYQNEAERVLGLGGEVWEVLRPGCCSDGHISEEPLPRELISRKIINDADLETLESRVRKEFEKVADA